MSALSVLAAAREAPSRDALVLGGGAERWTYAELAARVARAATHVDALGLAPGARVALVARSLPRDVVAVLALVERGVPFVPVHPRLTPPEVQRIVDDAAPAAFLDDAALDAMAGARAPAPRTHRARSIAPSEPLAILYTSGTTGAPKGAVLPRSAFLASAAASAENLGFSGADRWLCCMPLAHAGGLSILTRCLAARAAVVLEERFEPRAALETIRRARVTLVSVVPAMLKALLAEDTRGTLATLRTVLVGGAAAPRALIEECASRGIQALTTYGLTEACSQVTTQSPRTPPRFEAGSGTPLRGAEVTILDASGERAAPGQEGRIHVRGPMLMSGYLGREPLGAAWFDTGDVGALGERGELHVLARRTDLIVTGGENVYPVEVEQALESCEGVRAALVFGVPDETWGQIVAAAFVADAASELDEARLAVELAARLAPFKRPRRACVVDELPAVTLGKLDRAGAPRRLGGLLRPFPR